MIVQGAIVLYGTVLMKVTFGSSIFSDTLTVSGRKISREISPAIQLTLDIVQNGDNILEFELRIAELFQFPEALILGIG